MEVEDKGNGHYAFSADEVEGTIFVGGGVAIGDDGSETSLSAEDVASDMVNEVTIKWYGKTWLYYKSYAIDITDQMIDTDSS